MHSSTIFSIFTLAMVATALPNGSPSSSSSSSSPSSSPTCSTSAANKCCNGFKQESVLGILSNVGLDCTNIVGTTCTSGSAACCSNQDNGLVVVDVCQVAL